MTSRNPNNNYAAVKLAQALQLRLDHFAVAEATRRADMALAAMAALPSAQAPSLARPDRGMRLSVGRIAIVA